MPTPVTNFMVGEWAFVKDHPMAEMAMRIKPEYFLRSLCEFREIPLNHATLLNSGFVYNGDYTYVYEIVAGNGHTRVTLVDRLNGQWDIEAETLDKFSEMKKSICEYNVFLKVNQLQRIFKELELIKEIEYEKDLD